MPPESLWPDSIHRFDVTLPTTTENLSLDEALLESVESDASTACLRFWQPTSYSVVLGRSNNVATEVDIDQCAALGIPIYRRATGGGTVLIGPGCLCFTLALPNNESLRSMGISRVAKELMSRSASGLASLLSDVDVCGTSDLAQLGMKFSGNAQRWQRNAFLHHGTLLADFDLTMIDRCLRHPTREPDYRASRRHSQFVRNIEQNIDELKDCLAAAWNAKNVECPAAVLESAGRIASTRYQSSDWVMTPDDYRVPPPPSAEFGLIDARTANQVAGRVEVAVIDRVHEGRAVDKTIDLGAGAPEAGVRIRLIERTEGVRDIVQFGVDRNRDFAQSHDHCQHGNR